MKTMQERQSHVALVIAVVLFIAAPVRAQSLPPGAPRAAAAAAVPAVTSVTPPPDYIIGPDDHLSIVFWHDKDMSADVTVRPDGKISLPLLNEVQAAGYTPDQLRSILVEAAGKYVEEPNATVVVKEIHSRNAFITGNVTKPGPYSVSANMTVLQLISLAGGLQEFADQKNIVIIRNENGQPKYRKFNYKDVIRRIHPEQNIVLRPGDTVVVP